MPYDDLTSFAQRMRGVIVDPRERIDEDRDSLLEGDAVLSLVNPRFFWIPDEPNRHKPPSIAPD